jgi:hypothetical protein
VIHGWVEGPTFYLYKTLGTLNISIYLVGETHHSGNEYAAGTFVLIMNMYTVYAYKKGKLGVKL